MSKSNLNYKPKTRFPRLTLGMAESVCFVVISVYGCHGERDWTQVGVFQVVSFWKINMYIYIYGLHPATTWICLVGDFLLSTVVNQQEKAPFGSDYVLGLFPFAPFPSKSK